MDPLTDPWLQLGIKQIELFEVDNEAYMNCLVQGSGILGIWKMVYARAVICKELTPLEKIPQEIKEQLWLEANTMANGSMNKEGLIDLCKALLTIKVFIGTL